MAFLKDDIYTSSGTVMLQNFWTPYVSKYDTSSFYNWEQDNLPLYDLEERTYLLWEQQGFATSAGVPGLALCVSADAPALTLEQNSTIFTDVSSCIAAIPKVIRFPVLIEVCNFGDLGNLELHNFRIEEGGSIEIINRASVKPYAASSIVTDTYTPEYNQFTPLVQQFSSTSVSQDLDSSLYGISSIILGTRLVSSSQDIRLSSINSFLYPALESRLAPLSVALEYPYFENASPDVFDVTPYERLVDPLEDNTLLTYDVSATNQSTGSFIKRSNAQDDQSETGYIYFNNLSKLSVKNCDGPIYIRNFCVNGKSTVGAGTRVGIEINNSDVLLENCASVRCSEAGFKFNNSKVVLSRSAFAYRNYELSSVTGRSPNNGVGFHAINSDVSISALFSATTETGVAGDFIASGNDNVVISSRNQYGFILDNSRLVGGVPRLTNGNEKSGGILAIEQNTDSGLISNNSTIKLKGLLDFYGNNTGIKLNNSVFEYDELTVECNHKEGILSNASVITLLPRTSTHTQTTRKQTEFKNNGQHLNLQNHSVKDFVFVDHAPEVYGNTVFSNCHGVTRSSIPKPLAAIYLDNSKTSLIHPNIQVRDDSFSTPIYGAGIRAINNSNVDLYGTKNGCTFVWGSADFDDQYHSAGIYAGNESQVGIHGPTLIARFGIDILAEDNSTINIEPPKYQGSDGLAVSAFDLTDQENHTSVELHSTRACLVVNKSSTLNMKNLGGVVSSWPVAASGQAMTAFGYASDEITNINEYVGSGSLQFYPNPPDSDAITAADTDSLDLVTSFSISEDLTFTKNSRINACLFNSLTMSSNSFWSAGQIPNITLGGTCVRALAGSNVNVKNVHFPIGSTDSTLEAKFYASNVDDCHKLLIWNIADTSKLNASYLSVSGMYPADATYHGPSALWASSYNGVDPIDKIASGAPSGTPDTGSLSILDSFGAGSSVFSLPRGASYNSNFNRYYAVSGNESDETVKQLISAGINYYNSDLYHYGAKEHTYENKGVFRIYWSPKPSARLLQTDLSGYLEGAFPHGGDFSGTTGPAYQLFSQGYNCSAPLSAIIPDGYINASAIYPELLKISYDADLDGIADSLWTSGFYYCSEFLDDDPTQCMLDESASYTFANSKNANLGSSGRPKRVTIYSTRGAAQKISESHLGDVSGAYGYRSSNVFDLDGEN
jgi:hypothetical protein